MPHQEARLQAEREAHENSIFQAEFRIEAQQRLKTVLGNDVAEPIKALTKQVEESMVIIALIDEKLAALPAGASYAVLHPYPKFNYKMWTPAGWIALVRWLRERSLQVVPGPYARCAISC